MPFVLKHITALALCKTNNRFAIADSQFLTLYDYSPSLSNRGSISLPQGERIKRVCFFLTPNTFLGLTESGKVFIFSFTEHKQTIEYQEKKIKKNDGTKILLKNIAVDPCNPYHVMMHTQQGDIVYFDFKNCHDPALKKTGVTLLKDTEADSLWFYDDRLCLGYNFLKKMNKVSSSAKAQVTCYQFHQFDLSIQAIKLGKNSLQKAAAF